MTSNNTQGGPERSRKYESEIKLEDIVQIFLKRKGFFVLSVIIMLIIAVLYNFLVKPVYLSSVSLKKENTNQSSYLRDEFEKRFSFQTMDEVDTEMKMIKTRSVLEKVINELKLFVRIEKVELVSNRTIKFNTFLYDYNAQIDDNKNFDSNLPKFLKFELYDLHHDGEYFIRKAENNIFEIYDGKNNRLLQSFLSYGSVKYGTKAMQFMINWPNAKTGEKIYFRIINFEKTYENLQEVINVNREERTNIFKLSVKSYFPHLAQLLANLIVEKFREVRLEQKRQIVHYSFDFVDKQLNDISENLNMAEIDLSQFKSDNKIAIMDESSRDVIKSLSELEAEKVKTDLELAEYRNKVRGFGEEVDRKSYFDQTYLTPTESSERSTPFAVLLEQLSDVELRRLELLQKRKDTHPDVINIDEQIEQIKERLAEYNQNTLTAYRIIMNSLINKQANLSRLIRRYGSRLENLPDQEAQLAKLERQKNVYEKMYNLLIDKREELRVAEFSKLQDIVIIDPAPLPYKPIIPRKLLNLAAALLLGIFFGLFAVFVTEFFEKRITSIEDIERVSKFPILAVLPEYSKDLIQRLTHATDLNGRLVLLMKDQPGIKESYSVLRTKLIASSEENALIVTSCEEDSGKTTVALNLAISLARTGKRILLIDCDLRKAKLSDLFNVPSNFRGIINFLTTKIEIPKLWKPFKDSSDNLNLHLIPACNTTENADELLGSEKMKHLLESVKLKYDFVILDTPPVTRTIDPILLGQWVKNTLLIVRPNLTYKDSITFGDEQMQNANMNVMGIVVNAYNVQQASSRYKYGYGYGYGYDQKQSKKTQEKV